VWHRCALCRWHPLPTQRNDAEPRTTEEKLDLIIISFVRRKLAIARRSQQLRRFTRDCTRLAYLCVGRVHAAIQEMFEEKLEKVQRIINCIFFKLYFPSSIWISINEIIHVFCFSEYSFNEFHTYCKAIRYVNFPRREFSPNIEVSSKTETRKRTLA